MITLLLLFKGIFTDPLPRPGSVSVPGQSRVKSGGHATVWVFPLDWNTPSWRKWGGSEAHGIFKKPTGVIKIPSQGSIALGRDEPMVGLPARSAGKFSDVVFGRGCQRWGNRSVMLPLDSLMLPWKPQNTTGNTELNLNGIIPLLLCSSLYLGWLEIDSLAGQGTRL